MPWKSGALATLAGILASIALVPNAASVGDLGGSCLFVVDGWSPDGTKIAVERWGDPSLGNREVGIVNADGSSLQILSRPLATPDDQDKSISWAPDGRSIAYEHFTAAAQQVGPQEQSSVIRYDLSTGLRRVVGAGTTAGSYPSFGPHGLTYISRQGIVVGGRILVRGAIRAAAWSPDGTRLGFRLASSHAYYRPRQPLVITDAHGQHPRRLAHDADEFAWSADGQRFAYLASFDRYGHWALFDATADGSHPALLANGVVAFAFSPDGRLLAYESPGKVWIAAADGSGARSFPVDNAGHSFLTGDDTHLGWSPNSSRLVVGHTLLDISTGAEVPLPSGAAGSPAWSPDGSLFAEGSSNGLALIRADGSTYTQVDTCNG
jgi:Tol biopolymer transport system component